MTLIITHQEDVSEDNDGGTAASEVADDVDVDVVEEEDDDVAAADVDDDDDDDGFGAGCWFV